MLNLEHAAKKLNVVNMMLTKEHVQEISDEFKRNLRSLVEHFNGESVVYDANFEAFALKIFSAGSVCGVAALAAVSHAPDAPSQGAPSASEPTPEPSKGEGVVLTLRKMPSGAWRGEHGQSKSEANNANPFLCLDALLADDKSARLQGLLDDAFRQGQETVPTAGGPSILVRMVKDKYKGMIWCARHSDMPGRLFWHDDSALFALSEAICTATQAERAPLDRLMDNAFAMGREQGWEEIKAMLLDQEIKNVVLPSEAGKGVAEASPNDVKPAPNWQPEPAWDLAGMAKYFSNKHGDGRMADPQQLERLLLETMTLAYGKGKLNTRLTHDSKLTKDVRLQRMEHSLFEAAIQVRLGMIRAFAISFVGAESSSETGLKMQISSGAEELPLLILGLGRVKKKCVSMFFANHREIEQ